VVNWILAHLAAGGLAWLFALACVHFAPHERGHD